MALSQDQVQKLREQYNVGPTVQPKVVTVEDRIAKLRNSASDIELEGQQKKGVIQRTGEAFKKPLQVGADIISPVGRGLARPLVQATRGVQELIPGGKGIDDPVSTPFGEITPIDVSKELGQKGIKEAAFETFDFATLGFPAEKLLGTPLKALGKKLFGSAAKFKDVKKSGKVIIEAKDLVKAGIDERVLITNNVVENIGTKIDDIFKVVDEAIEEGKAAGQTISTKGLTSFLDELRNMFKDQVDVDGAKKAISEIDDMTAGFAEKYGNEIPIEVAQKVKKNTNTLLRKSFGELTTASVETQKQIARFLKEGILDKAPIVGDINKRVANLIKMEKQLSGTVSTVNRRQLLGLAGKVGGVTGGVKGALVGKLLEVADSPLIKSGAGIASNELGKIIEASGKKSRVSLVALINAITESLNREKDE